VRISQAAPVKPLMHKQVPLAELQLPPLRQFTPVHLLGAAEQVQRNMFRCELRCELV